MKSLLCFLFSTLLMFGVSYASIVTLAQTDDRAQAPADQTEEGLGVHDRGPTPEDRNPAGKPSPGDDVSPPDEDEEMLVPEDRSPADEPPPEDNMSPPEG
jgi:hypothetical protein